MVSCRGRGRRLLTSRTRHGTTCFDTHQKKNSDKIWAKWLACDGYITKLSIVLRLVHPQDIGNN